MFPSVQLLMQNLTGNRKVSPLPEGRGGHPRGASAVTELQSRRGQQKAGLTLTSAPQRESSLLESSVKGGGLGKERGESYCPPQALCNVQLYRKEQTSGSALHFAQAEVGQDDCVAFHCSFLKYTIPWHFIPQYQAASGLGLAHIVKIWENE